jgi:hypothetical protein
MPFKDPQLDLWNDFDKAGPQERPERHDAQEHFESVTLPEREVIDPVEDDADFEEERRLADKITAEQEAKNLKSAELSDHEKHLAEVRKEIERKRAWELQTEKKSQQQKWAEKGDKISQKKLSPEASLITEAKKRDKSRNVPDGKDKKEDFKKAVDKMYEERDPQGDIYPYSRRFR